MIDTDFDDIMTKLEIQIKMAAKANRRKKKICILLNLDKQVNPMHIIYLLLNILNLKKLNCEKKRLLKYLIYSLCV